LVFLGSLQLSRNYLNPSIPFTNHEFGKRRGKSDRLEALAYHQSGLSGFAKMADVAGLGHLLVVSSATGLTFLLPAGYPRLTHVLLTS